MNKVGRPRNKGLCKEKDCTERNKVRGFCNNHYNKQRYVKKVRKTLHKERLLCSMPKCNSKFYSRGLCQSHYEKGRRGNLWKELFTYTYICEHNSEHNNKTECRCGTNPNGRPRSDVPTYQAMHKRIRKSRTHAEECVEVGCHEPPTQWALIPGRGTHTDLSRHGKTIWYSLSENDYQSMCASHHKKMDMKERAYGKL